jgi:hypothetical protein
VEDTQDVTISVLRAVLLLKGIETLATLLKVAMLELGRRAAMSVRRSAMLNELAISRKSEKKSEILYKNQKVEVEVGSRSHSLRGQQGWGRSTPTCTATTYAHP